MRSFDEHDLRPALANRVADLAGDRGRMMPHRKPVEIVGKRFIDARYERIQIERGGPHGVHDRRVLNRRSLGHRGYLSIFCASSWKPCQCLSDAPRFLATIEMYSLRAARS